MFLSIAPIDVDDRCDESMRHIGPLVLLLALCGVVIQIAVAAPRANRKAAALALATWEKKVLPDQARLMVVERANAVGQWAPPDKLTTAHQEKPTQDRYQLHEKLARVSPAMYVREDTAAPDYFEVLYTAAAAPAQVVGRKTYLRGASPTAKGGKNVAAPPAKKAAAQKMMLSVSATPFYDQLFKVRTEVKQPGRKCLTPFITETDGLTAGVRYDEVEQLKPAGALAKAK